MPTSTTTSPPAKRREPSAQTDQTSTENLAAMEAQAAAIYAADEDREVAGLDRIRDRLAAKGKLPDSKPA